MDRRRARMTDSSNVTTQTTQINNNREQTTDSRTTIVNILDSEYSVNRCKAKKPVEIVATSIQEVNAEHTV